MVGIIRSCALCGMIGLAAVVANGCGSSTAEKPGNNYATMTAEQRLEMRRARDKATEGNAGDKAADGNAGGGK
jgi:hypothetical protein